MRRTIYVIMVTPEAGFSKVSQEAYSSFDEAVYFIKHCANNPQPISSHVYRDKDYTEYEICEVLA